MKLYTESEVRKAIELARDTHPEGRGYMQSEEYDYSMDEVVDLLTPIELPSDEGIKKEMEIYHAFNIHNLREMDAYSQMVDRYYHVNNNKNING